MPLFQVSQFSKICFEDVTNLAAGNNKYIQSVLSLALKMDSGQGEI